jgi:hypothetical protein
VNDTDARLRHRWLRINRVLRVMLHTRWSAEAWAQVRVEFRKALALRSKIRRAGWFSGGCRCAQYRSASLHGSRAGAQARIPRRQRRFEPPTFLDFPVGESLLNGDGLALEITTFAQHTGINPYG